MTIFFSIMTIILSFLMFLSLYRVYAGPTVYDRLTGVSLIATKTVVLLILVGYLWDRMSLFIDIALAYALLSLVTPIVLVKFFETEKNPS